MGPCAEPLPPTPTDYRCFGGFGSVVWVFVGWGVGLFGVAFEGRRCVVVCFFGLVCFVVVFLGGLGFFDEWFCGCCLTNGFVS